MVLYVYRYTIHPDKVETYLKWTEGAIKRVLAVPGVIELRAYRAATGPGQIALTYEFADMAAWAAWYSHADVQKVIAELYSLAVDISVELWGPSPVVPAPIRPGK
jgi:quinol monooxygenase YgiN